MFHVKQGRLAALLTLVGLLGLAMGCIGQQGARGWAAPVRQGDVVIVSTGAGRIDGIDGEGRQIWRFPEIWNIPDDSAEDLDGIYGRPLIGTYDGEDVVFVGDHNGYVYAFRPSDFEPGVTIDQPPAASFKLDGPVIGGLVLDTATDVLYVTSGSRVYGLRASDLVARIDNRDAQVAAVRPPPEGEKPGVLFKTGGEIWAAPVMADGKLLLTSLDGNLYALDPATGTEIWRFETEQGLVSAPAVFGDQVLVAGFGSTLYAVGLEDGALRWSFKARHWIWGDPAADGELAYVGDFDGIVHAVDLQTGAEAWSLDLQRDALRASPALAEGTVVFASDGGWLVGIDTERRAMAWERDIGTSLNADMTVEAERVLLAPNGCVTPEAGAARVYYTAVDPQTGDLSFTAAVC